MEKTLKEQLEAHTETWLAETEDDSLLAAAIQGATFPALINFVVELAREQEFDDSAIQYGTAACYDFKHTPAEILEIVRKEIAG
jgi:hypothetical protein